MKTDRYCSIYDRLPTLFDELNGTFRGLRKISITSYKSRQILLKMKEPAVDSGTGLLLLSNSRGINIPHRAGTCDGDREMLDADSRALVETVERVVPPC